MTIDVPMYFNALARRYRRRARATSRSVTVFATPPPGGWSRIAGEDWKWEMLWMSLYFSFGVWISVSLVRAPYPGPYSLTTTGNSADRR